LASASASTCLWPCRRNSVIDISRRRRRLDAVRVVTASNVSLLIGRLAAPLRGAPRVGCERAGRACLFSSSHLSRTSSTVSDYLGVYPFTTHKTKRHRHSSPRQCHRSPSPSFLSLRTPTSTRCSAADLERRLPTTSLVCTHTAPPHDAIPTNNTPKAPR
jgi:hypothetical protein